MIQSFTVLQDGWVIICFVRIIQYTLLFSFRNGLNRSVNDIDIEFDVDVDVDIDVDVDVDTEFDVDVDIDVAIDDAIFLDIW